ncbi:hypothetical protein [Nocardia sp. BMG51109]|uniref:hypothetical protein n=1 Tax=Nocardia sp. BMG51109 TaxID=1056816 RepID=UPI00046350F7|nr:hypothetical protein [Nocardia sp. BMG51109]
MTGNVDFMVTWVWNLPGRDALLVTGHLVAGSVGAGSVLVDADSGARIRVLGLDSHACRGEEYTLVVDRSDADKVLVGRRLVGAPAGQDFNCDSA